MCQRKELRDFYAITLYCSSLTFWAYGMISRDTARKKGRSLSVSAARPDNTQESREFALLDGDETPEIQRFIALGRTTPAIRRRTANAGSGPNVVPLSDPTAVMEVIIGILKPSDGSERQPAPPLVENLSQLMRDLGAAAGKVFTRRNT